MVVKFHAARDVELLEDVSEVGLDSRRHYGGQGAAFVSRPAVVPQGETCDVGYIGETGQLYIVCCDLDRRPPCVAYGLV